MSQGYYQQVWKQVQEDLRKTSLQEAKVKKKGPYPDLDVAKRLIGHLYMNYVKIVNRLDVCYDQMFHPQKREVIGRLLDLSLGRLLELKSEIVRMEFDDYCFFDNVLIELKMTHQDMQINVPKYFWRDREKAKLHRRDLIKLAFLQAEKEKFKQEYLKNVPEDEQEDAWAKYLANEEAMRLEKEKYEEQQRKLMGYQEEEKDSLQLFITEMKKPPTVDEEAVREAVRLIQRHERARQGRMEAVLAKRYLFIKLQGERAKISEEDSNAGAIVIQRHWRRHRRRLKEIKARAHLDEVLGLTPIGGRDKKKFKRIGDIAKLCRKIQDRNQAEYEEALVKIKDRVKVLYSIPMEEDIVDELVGWFKWFFEQTNYLPDFPPEKEIIPTGEVMGIPKKLGPQFYEKLFPNPKAKNSPAAGGSKKAASMSLAIALSGISAIGGSALVVAGHWIGPKEFLLCQAELEKMKKAGKPAKEKKTLTKEEKAELKKKEKEAEKKRLLAEEGMGFQLKESGYLVPLNKADRDYRTTWMDLDERNNYEQRYIPELIKNDKSYELSMEVRKVVDQMMVLELDILKEALERDKNPKKKPKKKKNKDKKEKKKKEKKDPTGDRTLDDLFLELFKNGIIKDYEEVYLNSYNGERSFAAFDKRQRLIDWPPSTGDVRELILQLCILPLGSPRIHQLSPLIRSICIMGAENSGKEFLARIVCTETASVMFDLTAENVAGKYPGKQGLKMLQHLIEKMSRALQPSILFVDGAEKTFYKKVPKEEKHLEPKRLANMIKKIVKGIKPPDQVLLLGVSSQPWMAQKRALLKTYQKIIFVPTMDYGSYLRLWQDLIVPYKSIPKDFDVSCLARVSSGFSVKSIMNAVSNVMTAKRVGMSKVRPLKQEEFLEELLKVKLADEKLVQKCLNFYSKTELPIKRDKWLKQLKSELEKPKR